MTNRRVIGAIAVLFFTNGTVFGSWLPRLPELRDKLGLSLTTVGLVLAASGVGGLLASGVSGRAIGRFGPRRVAIWPALTLSAILPLIGLAPGAVLLAVVVGVAAVFDALSDVGMNGLAVRAQEGTRHSIFTRLHALWSLGALAGAGVSAVAASAGVPLTAQLVAIGLFGFVAVAWAARSVPATDPRPPVRARRSLTLGIVAVGVGVALVENAPHDWGALFLTDVVGTSPESATSGFLALTIGMVAGRVVGDRVADRLGPYRAILGSFGVVAIAVAVVVLSRTPSVVVSGLALWGLGVSVVIPLLFRLTGSHSGFGEGSGLAALAVGNRLGFMAGPSAVGAVAATTSLPTALGGIVAMALVGSAVAVWWNLRR